MTRLSFFRRFLAYAYTFLTVLYYVRPGPGLLASNGDARALPEFSYRTA